MILTPSCSYLLKKKKKINSSEALPFEHRSWEQYQELTLHQRLTQALLAVSAPLLKCPDTLEHLASSTLITASSAWDWCICGSNVFLLPITHVNHASD